MTDETPVSTFRRLVTYMRDGLTLSAFFTVFAGVLWWIFQDRIVDIMETAAGTDRLSSEVSIGFASLEQGMAALATQVDRNTEELRRSIPDDVAEYDAVRSKIFSPCYFGKVCEAQLRAKRRDRWVGCSAPTVVSRSVVDAAGQDHAVDAVETNRVRRLSGDYRTVYPSFLPPERAAVGVAEYFMVLSYECPDPGRPEQDDHQRAGNHAFAVCSV